MTSCLAPLSLDRFCSFLRSALAQERNDSRQIATHVGQPEHLLSSVASSLSAFSPEFAIAYLVRKEVPCQDDTIERKYPPRDRSLIDFCLVINGGNSGSLEIKRPWGIWDSKHPPKDGGPKTTENFYNGWSLTLQDDSVTLALEQYVRSTLRNLPYVVVHVVSTSGSINGTDRVVSRSNSNKYECLRVVVMDGVMSWCDGCRQQVANSKLFSMGGGSIKVCRTCRMQATLMIRQ
jgi:hypothetical protein